MARLPYVDPAAAPETLRDLLQRLPGNLNVYRMMAHAENNFRPLVRLLTSIISQQQLSPKLREFAILRVAKLSAARYEWIQHVPLAEQSGATAAQIEALDRGDTGAACFAPLEHLVLRFTTEVVQDVRASDETFRALCRHLTPREIVELILAIGCYMAVARLLETTAVDLDPPATLTHARPPGPP